mmetsp:Transcript_113669/g.321863  ORF Transcript_113669/g.321863 Transcript_113669/m.321863 type:complete len:200 (+) Transcript_113669:1039-1638(+)
MGDGAEELVRMAFLGQRVLLRSDPAEEDHLVRRVFALRLHEELCWLLVPRRLHDDAGALHRGARVALAPEALEALGLAVDRRLQVAGPRAVVDLDEQDPPLVGRTRGLHPPAHAEPGPDERPPAREDPGHQRAAADAAAVAGDKPRLRPPRGGGHGGGGRRGRCRRGRGRARSSAAAPEDHVERVLGHARPEPPLRGFG